MSDQDQYGFIMNPDSAPQKKGGLPSFKSFSKKQLALIAGGGLILLLILITVASSLMNSGPTNQDHLAAVAVQQSEIIRISDMAVKDARGVEARNMAQTVQLSLRSDQSTLTAVFKAQKVKLPKATENAKNTQTLTAAQQNNRFDEVYLDLIQKELVEYQKKLNTAHSTSVNTTLKEAMKIQYDNASTLISSTPEN